MAQNQSPIACTSCKSSLSKKTLYRTAPPGTLPAIWMCMDCIKKLPPDQAKQIISQQSDLEQSLKDFFDPDAV